MPAIRDESRPSAALRKVIVPCNQRLPKLFHQTLRRRQTNIPLPPEAGTLPSFATSLVSSTMTTMRGRSRRHDLLTQQRTAAALHHDEAGGRIRQHHHRAIRVPAFLPALKAECSGFRPAPGCARGRNANHLQARCHLLGPADQRNAPPWSLVPRPRRMPGVTSSRARAAATRQGLGFIRWLSRPWSSGSSFHQFPQRGLGFPVAPVKPVCARTRLFVHERPLRNNLQDAIAASMILTRQTLPRRGVSLHAQDQDAAERRHFGGNHPELMLHHAAYPSASATRNTRPTSRAKK